MARPGVPTLLVNQEQRQTVSQKIDPKLIQANAMLQRSSAELAQEIEAELLANPALDVIEEESTGCDGNCSNPAQCPYCSHKLDQDDDESEVPAVYANYGTDHYPAAIPNANDEYDPIGNAEAEVTLSDYLRSQLREVISADDYHIGDYLVSSLNDRGWLADTVEDLAEDLSVSIERVAAVLSSLQTLDPPGIGARDVRECMLIQLRFLREDNHAQPLVERMVRDRFEDVVSGRASRMARAYSVPVDRVRAALAFIRSRLNPYPASQFRAPWNYRPSSAQSAIRPDVVIRRTEVGYDVEVLGAEPFVLGVNSSYRDVYMRVKHGDTTVPAEDRKHVVEYVDRAELFLRNLKQRRKTLKMITRKLIDVQQGFVATGSRAFVQPLTRTRIAEELDMHESTVSRATANKYVQLPNQEVVPFDVFFDSSLAAKSLIEEFIRTEDPAHPLSDQRIVELLREKGYDIARRTVVKYRDAQKILSSNRRRK